MPLPQTNPEPQLELRAIFLAHHRQLFNIAYRLTGSREEAEDVVQQIFVRLSRDLARFRREAELSTWLYRIVVNSSLDVLRRFRRRRRQEIPMSLIVNEPFHSTAAETHLHRAELAEKLQQALARLRPPFRAVIVLRDFEDMTYDQIAEVLRLDAGTVASRLSRARLKLKSELKRLGIDQSYLEN